MMNCAQDRNRKIIKAVLDKEKAICPSSIALIGIYGSFLTGDVHPLSDLDLLILINDDRGYQLAISFIEDDAGVGYDIYCTSWDSLIEDSRYEHPHIAKLMDSQIVYCADEKYRDRLEALRAQVRRKLEEPFGEADYRNAKKELTEARCCYANAMIAENLSEIRKEAGGVLYYVQNAVALLNKTYFRMGTRRCYEELNAMEKRPPELCALMDDVVKAATVHDLKKSLTALMKELTIFFENIQKSVQPKKKPVSMEALRGSYEEMFSNWRGKMTLAAETGDRHLAFMSLVSLQMMLDGIRSELDIDFYDAVSAYDPDDLGKTAEEFDKVLQEYLREYQKVGLNMNRFMNIEKLVSFYLQSGER